MILMIYTLSRNIKFLVTAPHVSLTDDPSVCSNQFTAQQSFKKATENPISFLPLWASRINKHRPDDPTKTMNGSILKLKIQYAGQAVEVDL